MTPILQPGGVPLCLTLHRAGLMGSTALAGWLSKKDFAMTEDEMYSGRFYRSDGIKIAVHEGENFAGDKGFYWCESVTIKVTDEQGNYNPVYLTGNSGMEIGRAHV